MLMLCSCITDNGLEGKSADKEYLPTDFSTVENFFTGFDVNDIINFHCADLTNYGAAWIPGPNVRAIEGYFELDEGKWDAYTKDYVWYEVRASNIPKIFGAETCSCWFESYAWNDEHRPKRIYGEYYICNKNKLVYFSLLSD